nr:TonB-dependent receptor [uncultured Flavobacterium sp.]
MRILFVAVALCIASIGMAQNKISGTVRNAKNETLPGAHVHLSNQSLATDPLGNFEFNRISDNTHRLIVSYIGYVTKDTVLNVYENLRINIILQEDKSALQEVVITTNQAKKTSNTTNVSQQKVLANYGGSFATSLENVAGINASQIGAGQSKPIIRGLSANRVAVTENGIKQEGQQWGADHGLEIDAFNTEKVEIIKGVGTIAYGSDAMGGVIAIDNSAIPSDSLTGNISLLGKSVNDGLGVNLNLKQRFNKIYFKANATILDYADYKIPTKNISYLNYNMPVHKNRLKNSAGVERNFAGTLGYKSEKLHSFIQVSNNYIKSGFFPGAHGIPNVNAVAHDGDYRNIEFPYQSVNHLKVISDNTYKTNKGEFNFKVAFQNNHRQEWSKFHTHYSNQTAPTNNPDLELDFKLITIDQQLSYKHKWDEKNQTKFGIQYQYQNNKSGGYSYLLPKFNRKALGVFATHEYQLSNKLKTEFGVRADWADLKINAYYDTILYQYLINSGRNEALANYYAQRTPELDKDFNAFNFALGLNYALAPNWNWNFTAASNFRFPTAIELASNGIHHGAFRHEQGDANLDPEKGWAFDTVLSHEIDGFSVSLSPYVYYFTNYIYLKPSGQFSILPHGGQIYTYTQSKALLAGFELELTKTFWNKLTVNSVFEYIRNQQLNSNKNLNYALPFTPANNVFIKVDYAFNNVNYFKNNKIYISAKHGLEQNRIAQNEEFTPSFTTFGAGLSSQIQLKKFKINAQLTTTNLFNEKYYNHSSYYRAVEIPELGRNIQLLLSIPF